MIQSARQRVRQTEAVWGRDGQEPLTVNRIPGNSLIDVFKKRYT